MWTYQRGLKAKNKNDQEPKKTSPTEEGWKTLAMFSQKKKKKKDDNWGRNVSDLKVDKRLLQGRREWFVLFVYSG